ncbi:hypothetical protein Y032_0489g2372 [Ancylostoma ceylanicum]|nr:hypothetical protein Y032_0489g2372 [Ancylostoma ceylanicum]
MPFDVTAHLATMLYFAILGLQAVHRRILSLSTALRDGKIKPGGDCKTKVIPITFPKNDIYVEKINLYRKLMVEGKQRNGNTGKNLPTGENVAEMVSSKTFVVFPRIVP